MKNARSIKRTIYTTFFIESFMQDYMQKNKIDNYNECANLVLENFFKGEEEKNLEAKVESISQKMDKILDILGNAEVQ